MSRTALLALSVALFCSFVYAGTLPRKLPGDTKIVVLLDIDGLSKKKPILALKKAHAQQYDQLSQHLKGLGLDIDKVEEIWLAGKSFDSLFVVVKGGFDTSKIAAAAVVNTDLKMLDRPGARIAFMLPDKGVKDVNMVAVIDDDAFVFGKPGPVEDYLKSLAGKAKSLKRSTEKKLERRFKGISQVQALINAKPDTNDPGLNNLFKELSYGQATMRLDEDLEMRLVLETKNSQKAKGIRILLHGLLFNGLNQPGRTPLENAIKKDLAANLSVEQKGKTITIESKIGKDSLAKIITMSQVHVPVFDPGKAH